MIDGTEDENIEEPQELENKHGIVFHNYTPRDVSLRAWKAPSVALSKQADDILSAAQTQYSIETLLDQISKSKSDWDLKQEFAPILTRLETKTQSSLSVILTSELSSDSEESEVDSDSDSSS